MKGEPPKVNEVNVGTYNPSSDPKPCTIYIIYIIIIIYIYIYTFSRYYINIYIYIIIHTLWLQKPSQNVLGPGFEEFKHILKGFLARKGCMYNWGYSPKQKNIPYTNLPIIWASFYIIPNRVYHGIPNFMHLYSG